MKVEVDVLMDLILPVPNTPDGLRGHKATFEEEGGLVQSSGAV